MKFVKIEYYSYSQKTEIMFINMEEIISFEERSYFDGYGWEEKDSLLIRTNKDGYSLTSRSKKVVLKILMYNTVETEN